LPPGWCGKQHACAVLADLARHEHLLFIDADVRLAPDAALKSVRFLQGAGADLVSGLPHEETETWAERLLIPLFHFILLGFLPLWCMRHSRYPAFGAACGQFLLTTRDAYRRAGGHQSIRRSRHDGIDLPRAYRRARLRTDLLDATPLARCRMYRSAGEVFRGFAKNATEGLAAPALLLPATAVLGLGQVLPALLFPIALCMGAAPMAWFLSGTALACAVLPRLASVRRFHQPLGGALLHPLGVAVFLGIQWFALALELTGRSVAWKGRPNVPRTASPATRT
jgi:hypothetical protein